MLSITEGHLSSINDATMSSLARTTLKVFRLVPLLASCHHSVLAFTATSNRSHRLRSPHLMRLRGNPWQRRTNITSSSASPTKPVSLQERLIGEEEKARVIRTGQANRRREKAARREDRISALESKSQTIALNISETAELHGLFRVRDNFEEQYDPTSFSQEHVEFKRLHNEAFLALARFCCRSEQSESSQSESSSRSQPNVFFLDGPDGGTASYLIEYGGLDPACCFVANRHLSTCQALRISGGGKLPDQNVLHATAAEALSPPGTATTDGIAATTTIHNNNNFSNIDFSAYYLDGCGGFVPHVVGMLSAALMRDMPSSSTSTSTTRKRRRKTTAVGFSLMGNRKDIMEKELAVCRALAVIARTRGMRTRHVMDDPGRFDVPLDIPKTVEQTFTTWILLEQELPE